MKPHKRKDKQYQLKMNSLKCAFGVLLSKFLGFIVWHRGIEIDQSKIEAHFLVTDKRSKAEVRDEVAPNRLSIEGLRDWSWFSLSSSIEV